MCLCAHPLPGSKPTPYPAHPSQHLAQANSFRHAKGWAWVNALGERQARAIGHWDGKEAMQYEHVSLAEVDAAHREG